jgi:hypothetical protein
VDHILKPELSSIANVSKYNALSCHFLLPGISFAESCHFGSKKTHHSCKHTIMHII